MPTGVLPAVAISGSSFRANISGEMFGVSQWTFLPLSMRPATILTLGNMPGTMRCPAKELGPQYKIVSAGRGWQALPESHFYRQFVTAAGGLSGGGAHSPGGLTHLVRAGGAFSCWVSGRVVRGSTAPLT